ncbi:MAG: cadherin-like beta sandwich domain-containing protein [Clostridia bacterium]|nr:cadherin-like beta sandwich domain-containing protein [Clostridia bacterium]
MRKTNLTRFILAVLVSALLILPLSAVSFAADTDIGGISVMDGETEIDVTPGVTAEEHEYTAVLSNETASVVVHATPATEGATVTINGTEVDAEGLEIEVPVSTSETPCLQVEIQISYEYSSSKYYLNLYREGEDTLATASLKNGETEFLDDFDSQVFEYNLTVDYEIDSLVWDYTTDATEATVQITSGSFEELIVGQNNVTVQVTYGLGTVYETNQEYVFHITRRMDSSLATLTVTGNNEEDYTPADFASDVLSYSFEVPYEVSSLTIQGTPSTEYEEDISIDVQVPDLQVGDNDVVVTASHTDGSETVYTLHVKRKAQGSDVTTLDNLALYLSDGPSVTISPAFDAETLNYTATVGNEIESVEVQVTLTEPEKQTYVVTNNDALSVGANTVNVFVYAENGVDYRKYTITVTREEPASQPGDNAYLSSMTVTGFTLDPVFSQETYQYALTVPNETESIEIETVAADDDATVVVSGNTNLTVGTNLVVVKVTAEDGTTYKEYKISVTRSAAQTDEKNTDPYLKTLYLLDTATNKVIPMSPVFDPETMEYTASASGVTEIRVRASNRGENGVWILGNTTGSKMTVTDGENKIVVTGKSQSGEKVKYTIILTVTDSGNPVNPPVASSDKDATLSAITITENVQISPAFSSQILEYTATVPNSVTSVTVSGTPTNSKATVTNRLVNLNEGENVVNLIVVSADNTASQTYVVRITRESASVPLTGTVSISGEMKAGSTLTAVLEGAGENSTVEYTWFVSGVSVGNGGTYTVREEDAGKMIYVVANGTGLTTGSVSSQVSMIEETQATEPATTEPVTTDPNQNQQAAKLPPIVVILIVVGCLGLIAGFAYFIFGRKR